MEKIVTILGTRPEIIRLSLIIPKLDKYFNNIIVHTGQNYNFNLDKIFFNELNIRRPDYYLGAKGSFGEQISIIISKLEKILIKEKPQKFLVLGDTNSSLGAIIARRLNIKVFHIEAGNRSYIRNSPEEVNRKLIDHCSDILMPYSYRSCENLLKEGIDRKKIFVIGNPITEVIKHFFKKKNLAVLKNKLNLKSNFFLITLHREENVDDKLKLGEIISSLNQMVKKNKIIGLWPIHPRTLKKINTYNLKINKNIKLIKPQGFTNFLNLENEFLFIITDSGTVQEEAAILNKPCLVYRDATERPETIESGCSILCNNKNLLSSLKLVMQSYKSGVPPLDYQNLNTSWKVLNIIKSFS